MDYRNMATDQAADILCRLVDPLERIGRDREFLERTAQIAAKRHSMTRIEMAVEAFSVLVPFLLSRHREDLYEVLAITTGKPLEAIEMQPLHVTVNDVQSCLRDGIMSFFPSSGSSAAGQ